MNGRMGVDGRVGQHDNGLLRVDRPPLLRHSRRRHPQSVYSVLVHVRRSAPPCTMTFRVWNTHIEAVPYPCSVASGRQDPPRLCLPLPRRGLVWVEPVSCSLHSWCCARRPMCCFNLQGGPPLLGSAKQVGSLIRAQSASQPYVCMYSQLPPSLHPHFHPAVCALSFLSYPIPFPFPMTHRHSPTWQRRGAPDRL